MWAHRRDIKRRHRNPLTNGSWPQFHGLDKLYCVSKTRSSRSLPSALDFLKNLARTKGLQRTPRRAQSTGDPFLDGLSEMTPRSFSHEENAKFLNCLNRLADLHTEPEQGASPKQRKEQQIVVATAYTLVLQVWLDVQGVHWPAKGVYSANLAGSPRGRPDNDVRLSALCARLKKEGKTWAQVAQQALPNESNRRMAAKRAEGMARSFNRKGSAAREALPEWFELSDQVLSLLGLLTAQEERRQQYDDAIAGIEL